MVIPISLLLLSWVLPLVSLTGSQGFCSSKDIFVSQLVNVIVLLKNEGYPPKDSVKRQLEGYSIKRNYSLEFQCLQSSEPFCIESCKWGAFWSPHGLVSFVVCFCVCLFCFLSSFLSLFPLLCSFCCLLVATIMSESFRGFWTCNRNLDIQVSGLHWPIPTIGTIGSWWSHQWGSNR